MVEEVLVRDAEPKDAAGVAAIYDHYVAHTVVTFEEAPVGALEMASRIAAVRREGLPWLVAVRDDRVLGYAYAGRWRPRSGYRFTVETSVYLDPDERGHGLGRALCTDLLERLPPLGVHAVIAGVALPNEASVRLHERLGFRPIAHFRQVGFKHGRWIDVGYWQRLLPVADARAPVEAVSTA